jgi:hypothetical protein
VVVSGIGLAAGTMPLPAAACEATLVLAYLLALELADAQLSSGTGRWVREHAPVLAAGFGSAALITAVAGLAVGASAWLAISGAAAAAAALLAAVLL